MLRRIYAGGTTRQGGDIIMTHAIRQRKVILYTVLLLVHRFGRGYA